MLVPNLETFKCQISSVHKAETGENVFPVYKSRVAYDLNPHNAYLKLARPSSPDAKCSFLLESAIGGEKLDRYSFLGTDPRKILTTGKNTEAGEVDPLKLLENELKQYKPLKSAGIPEFSGGAVGYVAYDCIKYFEPKTARPLRDPLQIPESILMLCDTVVAFDNVYQKIQVIHNIHLSDTSNQKLVEEEYHKAEAAIQDVIDRLEGPNYHVPQGPVVPNDTFESNVGQAGYEKFVATIQNHIKLGDVFQCVPSQRVTHPTDLHPFNIYRQLRTVNPSPYMFYIDFKDFSLIGASPEVLVKIENGRVITHPIAGTVRRGITAEEDDRLANELLHSGKDKAEHTMLVDLARNDINRICEPLSSNVDHFMKLERFSHVTHLVSQCSGVLRPDKTRFDAFRSIFPAGTVSGAPKVRAMQLIGELEQEVRGAYAGAVGHWGYASDNMSTCIALRTMMYKGGKVYLQAGGGIVFDSDPYEEFMETVNKMNSNVRTLKNAEEFFSEAQKQGREPSQEC